MTKRTPKATLPWRDPKTAPGKKRASTNKAPPVEAPREVRPDWMSDPALLPKRPPGKAVRG